ncbi:MAG: APA family basic amino acid/polyamine antiporter, partial [Myxococcota bacterium]
AVALAALVATANGLSSAQLAAAHPVSGGTYAYGHRFVHPVAGFLAGWMYLLAKSASAATASLGCAGYLLDTVGVDASRGLRITVAVGIVWVLTSLVAGGLRRSNAANIAVVTLTLVALAVFVLFGALSLDDVQTTGRVGVSVLSEAFDSPATLLHATALMFVAYTGYGRIATLGEEVRDPSKTIPRAIIATLVISMVVYVSVAATAVAVVGADAFAASTAGAAAPLEVVARSFAHPQVAPLVAVGAITAMAGVLLNLLLGLSRVLLAMARRREMPAALDKISAKTKSPTRSVWAIGGLIAVLVLFGELKTTWSFSAFTVLIYYGITNIAALCLPPESRRYPRWISWAGLLSCFGLAFFVDWPIWLAGVGLIGVGLLWRAAAYRLRQP